MKTTQICWTCKNATNRVNCVWVETLDKEQAKQKQGCIFKGKYLVQCNCYNKDEDTFKYLYLRDKAQLLGITLRTYQRTKAKIKKLNLGISVEEYYKIKREKKKKRHLCWYVF